MRPVQSIMHRDVTCLGQRDTTTTAPWQMRQHSIGSLPVCDGQSHPIGIGTDCDFVVKCFAVGHDPASCTAGNLLEGTTLRSVDIARALPEHDSR